MEGHKGDNEFFNVTKSFHNSLQNGSGNVNDETFAVYEKWQDINASEIPLDYDVVFIHDPQPAGLIKVRKKESGYGDVILIFPIHIQRFGNSFVSMFSSMTP